MQFTSKALTLTDRVYRLMLFTYPASFRREFGVHMAQVHRDKCRMKITKQGFVGLCQIWFSTLWDWLTTVPEQHLEEVFQMSGQKRFIRLGAIAALAGGVLGLLLLTQGPNSYGNYGWSGWLATIAPVLFILGLGGSVIANQTTLTNFGKAGLYITIGGLVLMGLGHGIEPLWPFIGFGPLIIVPIGAIMLGLNIYQYLSLPIWWRFFPFIIVAIAVLGFSIEIVEEFSGNSTPDRGIQTVEALFSIAWIGLGIGLWINREARPDDPRFAA